jgi:hypothetical protein
MKHLPLLPTRSQVVRSDTVEHVGSDDRFATKAVVCGADERA